jgi:hypothetical protein
VIGVWFDPSLVCDRICLGYRMGSLRRIFTGSYSLPLSSRHLILQKTREPSDEPTVHFLVASDELQRKSREDSSTGWSDSLSEDTVGLSDVSFESRQRRSKTNSSAPDEPAPWSRGSVGLSDGHVKSNRDDLAAESSAPDEPTCDAPGFWLASLTLKWPNQPSQTGWHGQT